MTIFRIQDTAIQPWQPVFMIRLFTQQANLPLSHPGDYISSNMLSTGLLAETGKRIILIKKVLFMLP